MKGYKIIDACHSDMDFILDLNQRFTPAVSDSSNDMISYFLDISNYFKVMKVDKTSIGFLIALMPGKDYQSENYRWFDNRYESFMYIDRVVISKEYQGRGYGKLFYDNLCTYSKGHSNYIVCEVNKKPLNQQSITFHKKYGFYEVGVQDTESGKKCVSLMVYNISN
tara:strand:- start:194 stop:691 length:498 start_codon:yes stop_codon:yes gene_type:complete